MRAPPAAHKNLLGNPPGADDADLLPRIDECLADAAWLTPIPPLLRPRYDAVLLADRRAHNRRTLLILTIMFDFFLLTEIKTAPDVIVFSAILRLAVFTPLVLGFVVLDARHRLKKLYGPYLCLLAAAPTLISAILVLSASHADVNGASDVRSIPLILLVTGLIMRLTPGEVVVNVILSVVSTIIALLSTSLFSQAELGTLIFIDVSVGLCAIVFSWQTEVRDRRLFLLQSAETISRATLAALNRGLLAQTQTDGLTGVANRRHFDDTLDHQWRQAAQDGTPTSLLLIDIDHFKLFNDHYGHQGGDDCLRRLATAMRGEVRTSDLFARYGGEEFAAILPNSTLEDASAIAERMRSAVAALSLPHAGLGEGCNVSISLGAATSTPGPEDDPRHLIERADANLYAAKRAGRNRVYAAA
jgi:diguanylate cyclase (GGDEF)-like protein